ncbi:hypothetical protein DLJ53_31460 [Acuticoccus sediminis]|uniref:TRAP-type C4-dicarboxylate transport system substrate-binding protein n=1 Tax=Acuticoccus sediminis TaxID=2184697 RepID=A0A8B2NHH8_9HYPH|nr:TRAP transporter substrate-binding protein [Acuticoccus sediminis]RAH96782.1 hypothetical protein DLJ53_31460 [Acuticoccus sediminis]
MGTKFARAALGVAAAAFLAAGLGATDADAKQLRFVHAYPTASQHHKNVQWFTQEVTKRTDGDVTFQVFPSAQVMPINQELPAILSGQVSMTYSVAPIAASVEPLWGIFDLPFLFDIALDDTSHGRRFFDSEKGGGMLASAMEKRGFKLVSIAPTDYPSSFFLTKPEPVETMDGLHGLKLRSPGGRIGQLSGETFGYSPIAIAGVELVPALTQGVVDGGILPPIYTRDNKLPLKGLTVAPYNWPAVTPIIMSLAEFKSLPEKDQKVIMEVGAELSQKSLKIVEEQTTAAIKELEAGGAKVVYISEADLPAWREKAQPVWEAFVEMTGEDGKAMLDEAISLR